MTTGSNDWGGLGKVLATLFGIWVGVKAVEGISGKPIGQLLVEYGQVLARERQRAQQEEWERKQRALTQVFPLALPEPAAASPFDLTALDKSLTAALAKYKPNLLPAEQRPTPTPSSSVPVAEPDAAWRQKIVHPSVVLIVGKRGSGKSALGYRLLELLRYTASPYVVGVPASARQLLPDWVGIASTLEEVPTRSIALIDEAYLAYHARGSMAAQSKAMSQLLNLSRQREQTLLFVSQEARQIDLNISSSANVIVFKDLGMLQLAFDRPELTKLAAQAREAFASAQGDRRRWAYLYAPDRDFMGMLASELPSFWKPSLSRLFAAEAPPAKTRRATATTPKEKAERAKAMREQGASYGEIAAALGVTRGTVVNYLKNYPYRPR